MVERLFALAVQAPSRRRRCLLFLPLCPVYGLAMTALTALPAPQTPWLLPFWGGIVATLVEYVYHWAGQQFLGVLFWDYRRIRGSIRGRVCPPFSLAWGGLTALSLWWIQPGLAAVVAHIPPEVTYGCLLVFTADCVFTIHFLRHTHDLAYLRSFSLLPKRKSSRRSGPAAP